MKLTVGKQQFKTVSAKQAEVSPVLADRIGRKRAQVEFQLPVWEVSDLATLVEQQGSLLLTCLNNAIADLAKAKFAENGTNWDWKPDPEVDLSLSSLVASFESSGRGRVLTNESAGKLVAWIQRNVSELVAGIKSQDDSYTATQLTAICTVITSFTVYAAKDATVLAKVVLRLEQIGEAIAGSEGLAESFSAEPSLADVYEALIKKFSRADEIEITADAL